MVNRTCLTCTNDECETFDVMQDALRSIGILLARDCTLYELRPSLAEGGGTSPETLCSCGKTKERIAWRCDECDAADPKCGCGLSLVNGKCPSCRGRTS